MTTVMTDDPALLPGFDAWRARDYAGALDVFGSVLADDPDCDDAWRGIGSVYWSTGSFDRAMDAFQNALRIQPWSAVHWSDAGLAARDLKLFDQALNLFDVALAIDAQYHPAWNERSNVLYDMTRFKEAIGGYDQALTLCQTEAVYYHNRGECRLALGDKAAALANFRQAVEVDPAYSFSLRRLEQLAGPAA